MDYAILDVETTGGKFNEESITEIAVYRFNGEQITDTFISLINPEKDIHFYVQKLTGITKKMVKTAPKFYELAKRLVEITDDTVLVGHNVTFDYRIIRSEFSRLGFEFQRPTLDTITLSKILIPGMASYSLGNLCTSLGIPVSERHRAHGDAWATVKLFQLLLDKDSHKNIIKTYINQTKHQSLNKKIITLLEKLPQSTGVFYLHDEKGKIIYIDHSFNISNKARQILTGKSQKSRSIQKKTEQISFELTGSEIIASLKAFNEIKVNTPEYIPIIRKTNFHIYGVFANPKQNKIFIAPLNSKNKKNALLTFPSLNKGTEFLTSLEEKTNSCCDLILELNFNKAKYMLLTDHGRTLSEKSFMFFEEGTLTGYGFYTIHSQIKNVARVKKIMTASSVNEEILIQIRNKFFVSNKLQKIILSL
jgi:DNA polymerase III subunit epsilon